MAKRNGGIIGPSNVPGQFSAKGVWRLRDAFNYIKAGLWPITLGYQIPNSLRFNDDSSDYLSRTPATATNRRTWTWSGWIKRANLGTTMTLFGTVNPGTSQTTLNIDAEKLSISSSGSGFANIGIATNALLRDVSAWYHVMFVLDTTQATSTNRAKIYINGVEASLSTATYPAQNSDGSINQALNTEIGRYNTVGFFQYFDGYMSEVNFIDGQALTPSSFGQTDSTTGIWTPLAYTGTYGTNGFYLKFANSASLGTDSSGNGNNFTVNNLTSIDQSYDSPTNNFCTMNPLDFTGTLTSSDGNLTIVGARYRATFGVSTGKWYWEIKRNNAPDNAYLGIKADNGDWSSTWSESYTYYTFNGNYYLNGNNQGAYGTSSTTNDILMFALDMDNGKFYVGENGTWYNSGNPATSTNPMASSISGTYLPTVINNNSTGTDSYSFNFGYPPFTISSGNADANGFGNFEYAVPSGYYALCSKNLAIYG